VISHEYKCINVHIPRTGGSSIEMMLAGKTMENADHRTIHYYREQNNKVFNDYFKFSFVRNPWSKMVSHYIYKNYIREDPPKPQPKSFKAWIKNSTKHNLTERLPTHKEYGYVHLSNQLDWLCDKRWKNQIPPRNFEIDVDFVGRFENYEEDWNFICQKINLKTELLHERPGIQGKKNPKNTLDYREYYDDECIEIVRKRFDDDIKFFNYKFE
jgi:hypothetical protein